VSPPRGLPVWWLCPDEAAGAGLLDALSLDARRRREGLSIIDSVGTGISNLSVAENILLPSAWHASTEALRPEVLRWLSGYYTEPALKTFLAARSSGLSSRERQRQAVARAIQSDARCVLFDDDSHAHERWIDEWRAAIETGLPDARIQAVSVRRPSSPERWCLRAACEHRTAA